ncbi:MAG: hypothetical protein MR902_04580 [Campylobacter sp.]|nr:hypothetical protein [Campylobacter sp.]
MSNQNLNQNAKEDINTLNEKSKIDEQINEKQSELEEFKYPKQKRDFLKKTLELMADYLYSIEFEFVGIKEEILILIYSEEEIRTISNNIKSCCF